MRCLLPCSGLRPGGPAAPRCPSEAAAAPGAAAPVGGTLGSSRPAGTCLEEASRGVSSVLGTPAAEEFKMVIDNSTGRGLGVRWDGSEPLRISEVMPGGLVEQWNETNHEYAVRPGDSIVEVNGIRNDVFQMKGELDQTKKLKLLVRRQGAVKRIMPRDMDMYQSWGHFRIHKLGVDRWFLMSTNSFHMILHLDTWKLITICLIAYALAWLLFAAWWLQVAEPCNVQLATYREALYLSIETMMTIGFGVDDPYFNDCSEALPLLFFQSFTSLLLDIAVVGAIFQRFSRAYRRAATIIFSNNALIRERTRGAGARERTHLAFRIVEMQETPLLQCTLQAYCVLHRVDADRLRSEESASRLRSEESAEQPHIFGGLSGSNAGEARLTDAVPEEIEEVVIKPLKLQQLDTTNTVLCCGLPMTVTHTIDRQSPLAPCNRFQMTCAYDSASKDIYRNMETMPYLEVIVILSGVEEITGASVEARQSYTMADIKTEREFHRCVSLGEDGRHTVDFRDFHKTTPLRKESFTSHSDAELQQDAMQTSGGARQRAGTMDSLGSAASVE